jgi:exodeoxyribonuclease VIII
MSNGTLAHCALLEPDQLLNRYVVVPSDAPRKPTSLQRNAKNPASETLYAIKWWAEFAAEHGAKEVIDADQLLTAQRQAAAIRALPEIGPLLSRGQAEVSAFWIDEATGVLCKVRPDWVTPANDAVVLLDLKTTTDASRRGFRRAIGTYRYDLQAAFYSDGYEKASGLMVLGFVFVVVESEWPHAAATYMLDDPSMAKARNEVRDLLDLYADCKSEGMWPGYMPLIQPISTPEWA